MIRTLIACGLCVGLATSAASAFPIVNGQIDTFQNGTVQGWGGGAAPSNVANGGPLGNGDRYLKLTASGDQSPGGTPAARNTVQWSGDYLTAGVNSISMDMVNFGATPLDMRVVLFGDSTFTSTVSQSVPADGLWHNYSFGLTTTDLTWVDGSGTGVLSATLSNVFRLLIRNQAGAPGGTGESTPWPGSVGWDNITAHGVPEPATLALMALGAVAIIRRRR